MRFRAMAVVAVAALPLVGAACSSSSKSSSSSQAASVTTQATDGGKAAFVAQANQVCSVLSQLPDPPGNLSDATAADMPAWSSWLQTAESLGGRMMTQLRALTPPAGDRATVDDFLTKEQTSLDDGSTAQKAAASGDVAGLQAAMTKANDDGDAANQVASDYGLTTCANGGSNGPATTPTTAGP